jgi:hypothetical protein
MTMRKLLVFATAAAMSTVMAVPGFAAQRSKSARAPYATTQQVNPVLPFGYDAYARANGYYRGSDDRGFGYIGPSYGWGPYPDRPYGDPDRD